MKRRIFVEEAFIDGFEGIPLAFNADPDFKFSHRSGSSVAGMMQHLNGSPSVNFMARVMNNIKTPQKRNGCVCWLYLDGHTLRYRARQSPHPWRLVGVYDKDATRGMLHDDILYTLIEAERENYAVSPSLLASNSY